MYTKWYYSTYIHFSSIWWQTPLWVVLWYFTKPSWDFLVWSVTWLPTSTSRLSSWSGQDSDLVVWGFTPFTKNFLMFTRIGWALHTSQLFFQLVKHTTINFRDVTGWCCCQKCWPYNTSIRWWDITQVFCTCNGCTWIEMQSWSITSRCFGLISLGFSCLAVITGIVACWIYNLNVFWSFTIFSIFILIVFYTWTAPWRLCNNSGIIRLGESGCNPDLFDTRCSSQWFGDPSTCCPKQLQRKSIYRFQLIKTHFLPTLSLKSKFIGFTKTKSTCNHSLKILLLFKWKLSKLIPASLFRPIAHLNDFTPVSCDSLLFSV